MTMGDDQGAAHSLTFQGTRPSQLSGRVNGNRRRGDSHKARGPSIVIVTRFQSDKEEVLGVSPVRSVGDLFDRARP